MPATTIDRASESTAQVTAPKLSQRTASTQKDIEKEIESGLPNQIGRMRDAYDCLRYSKGRFEEYPTRHKDMRYRSPSVRRTSPLFKRIVEILTMHLYKNSPTRKLRDPEASLWLEQVYKRNFMAARFKRADQLSLIGGFAGFKFSGSTDPHSPLDIELWGADQLAFWVDPERPTKCMAVATVDFWDNRRRLRLFTQDEIVTYDTDKGVIHPAFGGTAFRKLSRKRNPYRTRPTPENPEGEGIVPFSFSHWDFPAQDFETNSPGLNLKELNQSVNERLDNLGDSIYFNCKPIGLARNVDDAWTPPAEIRPGDFIILPASSIDAGGNGPEPTLSYLMPDLTYVAADWQDLNANLDHQLEMWNVPPALIRMVQSGARSGASLQAEQLPILGWVEGRRGDWACYEDNAALTAFKTAESHLRNVGLLEEADQLQTVIDEWSFTLRWPRLYIQLPGPDRDRADDWRLSKGIVSLIGIMQERDDLNEEEAFDALQKVAQQNARLQTIGVNPNPQPPNPFGTALPIATPPPLASPEDQEGSAMGADQQKAEFENLQQNEG